MVNRRRPREKVTAEVPRCAKAGFRQGSGCRGNMPSHLQPFRHGRIFPFADLVFAASLWTELWRRTPGPRGDLVFGYAGLAFFPALWGRNR